MNSVAIQTPWSRLQQLAQRWHFVRGVALLSGGTVVAQVLNLALAPMIARLYAPADVGRLAVFISYINIASLAVALRYELGIVSAASEREAAGLVLLGGLFTVPLSLLSALLLHLLIKYSVLGFGALPAYAGPLMMLALVVTGIFTTLRYWMVRRERFSLISQATVLQQGVRVLSQAGLGFLGSSTGGLLAGELAGRAMGIERMLQDALPSLRRDLANIRLSELREFLVRNRKFPAFSLPSSVVDAACINLIVPLIVLQYGSASGGQFALVSRVMSVPLVLIATSVADVFHSRMAVNAREHPLSCSSLFFRTGAALLLIGSIPAAAIMLFGQPVFAIVFGKTWATAGVMAAAMAPWFLAQFVINPLSRLVLVLEGQEFKLVYDLFTLGGVIAVFWSAKHYSWPVLQTIRYLTGVNVLGYAIWMVVLLFLLRRAPRRELVESHPGSLPSSAGLLSTVEPE